VNWEPLRMLSFGLCNQKWQSLRSVSLFTKEIT
jgi:hypothetical protein